MDFNFVNIDSSAPEQILGYSPIDTDLSRVMLYIHDEFHVNWRSGFRDYECGKKRH